MTVLTIYLVLLLVIPSSLSFASLGSALGRPATLWALCGTLWWGWYHLQRHRPNRISIQPVRIAASAFVAVALISYAWAMLRGSPTIEISTADNGLIRVISWVGILLIANDGITDPARFRTLMRRIAVAGGLMATLGLLQFITGQSLLDWFNIPGMSSDLSFAGIDTRAGFVRASATATHPLEYGVVLSMAFPIALSLAIEEKTRSRFARWYPVAAMGIASVLAVSRSALIGLAAGLLMLFPTWSRNVKIAFSIVASLVVVAIGILVPGLAGTIRGLFTGLSGDASTLSRVNSYDSAAEFFARFPIVGKGFGTFLPSYHILDNQYLLLAIELGAAGIIAFVGLIVTAIWSAHKARRLAMTPLDRALCQAIFAAVVAGAILMAFFDGLSFPMSAGMLFMMIGICGGARRAMTAGHDSAG